MSSFLLLTLLLGFTISVPFFAFFNTWLEIRRIKRATTVELNRSRLGELRTRLVHDSIRGEIDLRRPYGLITYRGLTVLMRHPHAHEYAADMLLKSTQGTISSHKPTEKEIFYVLAMVDVIIGQWVEPVASPRSETVKLREVAHQLREQARGIPISIACEHGY